MNFKLKPIQVQLNTKDTIFSIGESTENSIIQEIFSISEEQHIEEEDIYLEDKFSDSQVEIQDLRVINSSLHNLDNILPNTTKAQLSRI